MRKHQSLGQVLREARRKAGLTTRQMAEKLNTHNPNISRWETGAYQPSSRFLRDIAAAYGLDLHEILSRLLPR